MSNGFGALTGSSRPAVGRRPHPDNPAPSLRPHYQASPLLRAGPSLCPASVRCHLGSSLSPPPRRWPYRGDRFTRSARAPGPGSRHLYAGERLASRQVTSRLIPGQRLHPGFALVDTLSTRHRLVRFRSPSGSTPDTRLCAVSATLSTPAHSPAHLAVVCDRLLQGDHEGPTSITRAALLGRSDLLHLHLPRIRVTQS